MPNRNRHRSHQNMNTHQAPIVAVQVNPSQLWAEQPSVVVTAEVFAPAPAPETNKLQRLTDQVDQLKKSNKEFKKSQKELKKAHQELKKDHKEIKAAEDVVADKLRDVLKYNKDREEKMTKIEDKLIHQKYDLKLRDAAMSVEGAYTDEAICQMANGEADELLYFDFMTRGEVLGEKYHQLPSPPPEVSPTAGNYRLRAQQEHWRKFVETLPDDKKPDEITQYSMLVQANEYLVERNVHNKMKVKTAFMMSVKDWLALTGAQRHWVAGWSWHIHMIMDSDPAASCGDVPEILRPDIKTMEAPVFTTEHIVELKKLCNMMEESVSGQSKLTLDQKGHIVELAQKKIYKLKATAMMDYITEYVEKKGKELGMEGEQECVFKDYTEMPTK